MRTAFLCLLACLIGLSIGLMINIRVVGDAFLKPPTDASAASPASKPVSLEDPQTSSEAAPKGADGNDSASRIGSGQEALIHQAYGVLNTLKEQDYVSLSALVHPTKGLTFTPYSTVDPSTDRTFTSIDLSKAKNNTTLYVWGLQDGSGLPIELTVSDYFKRYVYNAPYTSAPMIGINTVLSSGNSLENVAQAYPDAQFVEFYYSGILPDLKGFDWCGLKLVFELAEGSYYLVGIIHSEWTI